MSLSIRALTHLIQPPGSADPRDRCWVKRCKLGGAGPSLQPCNTGPSVESGLILPRAKLSKRHFLRLPCVSACQASRAGLREGQVQQVSSRWGDSCPWWGLRWEWGKDLKSPQTLCWSLASFAHPLKKHVPI